MKIFSKQKDEDFIIEEPENIMINNFGKNTPVVLHELTAEEILNSNQAAQPRFDGQSALKSLKHLFSLYQIFFVYEGILFRL